MTDLDRRRFLRLLGLSGAAATVGVGSQHGAVQQGRAVPPALVGMGYAAGKAGVVAGAAGYALGSSGGVDPDEYEDHVNFETHLDAYTDAREMDELNSIHLDPIRNHVNNVRRAALDEAAEALFAAAANDRDESTAESEAKDAALDRIAVAHREVVDAFAQDLTNAQNIGVLLEEEVDPDGDLDILEWIAHDDAQSRRRAYAGGNTSYWLPDTGTSGSSYTNESEPVPIELVNGENYGELMHFDRDRNGIYTLGLDHTQPSYDTALDDIVGAEEHSEPVHSLLEVAPPEFDEYGVDPDDYDDEVHETIDQGPVHPIHNGTYMVIQDDLLEIADEVEQEVEALVAEKYDEIKDDEVDITDLTAPSWLVDVGEDADDAAEAAMLLRGAGLNVSNEPALIDFDPDGDDESTEFEGYIGVSSHIDPLEVGTTHIPDGFPGIEFSAAIQWVPTEDDVEDNPRVDEEDVGEMIGEVVDLDQEFAILATDSGADALSFEDRDVVDSDLDVDDIRTILENHHDAEQEAHETTVEVVVGSDDLFDFDLGWSMPSAGSLAAPIVGGAAIIGGALGLTAVARDDD